MTRQEGGKTFEHRFIMPNMGFQSMGYRNGLLLELILEAQKIGEQDHESRAGSAAKNPQQRSFD